LHEANDSTLKKAPQKDLGSCELTLLFYEHTENAKPYRTTTADFIRFQKASRASKTRPASASLLVRFAVSFVTACRCFIVSLNSFSSFTSPEGGDGETYFE